MRTKTIFGIRDRMADVIICFKFYGNWLRGFWAVRGQKWGFPINFNSYPYNRSALPCCLWSFFILFFWPSVSIIPRDLLYHHHHVWSVGQRRTWWDSCVCVKNMNCLRQTVLTRCLSMIVSVCEWCVSYSATSALSSSHSVAVTNSADCSAWRDVVSQVCLCWKVGALFLFLSLSVCLCWLMLLLCQETKDMTPDKSSTLSMWQWHAHFDPFACLLAILQ